MNKNLIIVLIGGFLVAVVVALMVSATLGGGGSSETTAKKEDFVQIAVADTAISLGGTLSEENVRWQDWPKSAVFADAIVREGDQDVEDVVTGMVKREIGEGEPISKTAIVENESGNFVAATLETNKRAVGVNVTAASMAGGFIGPGDYVDVVLTYKDSVRFNGENNPQIQSVIELNLEKYASETILQNVRVLAVDQRAKPAEEEDDEKIKVGKTVTLEVDQRGAEILAVAGEMGSLSLSLRRLGDKSVHKRDYKVVTDKRITSAGEEVLREMEDARKASGQNTNVVRIYNGFSLSEEPVRQ